MSYHPPRQERWPQATPAEGWPSQRDREDEQAGRAQRAGGSHRRQAGSPSAVATAAFPVTRDAFGNASAETYATDGYRIGDYRTGTYRVGRYPGEAGGYHGTDATAGFGEMTAGFEEPPAGYPGGAYLGPGSYTETAYSGYSHSGAGNESSGSGYYENGYSGAGYADPGYAEPGYSDPGYSDSGYSEPGYFGSGYSDPRLTAPDAGVYPEDWQAGQARRRAAGHRGRLVSAVTEFLGTAVVIGVSTLAAGVLRSPVSPIGAMGAVFSDHVPAVLRSHVGPHGLLLGMYAVIAVTAIVVGVAARRAAALGVTGIAAFALLAAFIAVTRPASHVADVMPAVIGGLAGIAALTWLVRASAPIPDLDELEAAPFRPARGGTRRRTR